MPASSPEKRELTERLGADASADSRAPELRDAILEANEGKPVDAVLEMTGGETFEACLRTLAPFGRHVVGLGSLRASVTRSTPATCGTRAA